MKLEDFRKRCKQQNPVMDDLYDLFDSGFDKKFNGLMTYKELEKSKFFFTDKELLRLIRGIIKINKKHKVVIDYHLVQINIYPDERILILIKDKKDIKILKKK